MPIEKYDALDELLELIRGLGKFWWMGPGIHTHPGMGANQDRIHAMCLELERRGLIHRHHEVPGHIVWMPNTADELAEGERKMTITNEQIKEWRKLKGGMVSALGEYTPSEFWDALDEIERLQKHAEAAVRAEREACAKLCEKLADDPMMSSGQDAIYCAEAIRERPNARGEAPPEAVASSALLGATVTCKKPAATPLGEK